MTTSGFRDSRRDLERVFREGSRSRASDARLLERFVADGDPLAFEGLVSRYRDMLLRTCHELLLDPADAEQAFQATVVILSRRATAPRPGQDGRRRPFPGRRDLSRVCGDDRVPPFRESVLRTRA